MGFTTTVPTEHESHVSARDACHIMLLFSYAGLLPVEKIWRLLIDAKLNSHIDDPTRSMASPQKNSGTFDGTLGIRFISVHSGTVPPL